MVEALAELQGSAQHSLPSAEQIGATTASAEATAPPQEDLLGGLPKSVVVAALERQIRFHEREAEEMAGRWPEEDPEVIIWMVGLHRQSLQKHRDTLEALGGAEVVPLHP